eukprot:scaffold53031_cov24-Tisochrysis_lutea.AAC.2
MRVTKPDYPPDLRDEGLVLYALQRYEEAAQALTQYLEVRDAPGCAREIGVWCTCKQVRGAPDCAAISWGVMHLVVLQSDGLRCAWLGSDKLGRDTPGCAAISWSWYAACIASTVDELLAWPCSWN